MSPATELSAIALILLLIPLSESQSRVVLDGDARISSENKTFELGFFSLDSHNHYLGIWYASISPPTYIWVANRENPIRNVSSAILELTDVGGLAIRVSANGSVVLWRSERASGLASEVALLESGNLVLRNPRGSVTWQSFDSPADTWLPGMNLSAAKGLSAWRSASDPGIGLYALRLRPDFGEFELVFNGTEPYWLTGNWTGKGFAAVPEMMVPYIYGFHFENPFEETASFGFTERDLGNGLGTPLTRFRVDPSGRFRQYTWQAQTESWNMFWSRPDGPCRVFGACGEFGLCNGDDEQTVPCECLSGFEPRKEMNWASGDFTGGCRRENDGVCGESDDGFEEVGVGLGLGRDKGERFSSSLSDCKNACLEKCDCVGAYHEERTNLCEILSESPLNLRNLSSVSDAETRVVSLRVPRKEVLQDRKRRRKKNDLVLTAAIVGSFAALGFTALALLLLLRRRWKKEEEDEGVFPVSNLRVFSYKELHQATNGFSEKLGHGGFGGVFHGKLPDSTVVAVKRLERPGSGEKEFRAEVCTIGNIQHVNLARLLGFCSEEAHRLLIYDYMPNGSLSGYLRAEGPLLSWQTRLGVATGAARGIAYLHEGCRDCIIHCDIKPENILLDAEFAAKVSDFGLAKLVGRDFSRVMATMRGTWGYMAPEWISGAAITAKADVYSFGMTLIELVAGRRNSGPEKWFLPPWAAARIAEGDVAAVVDPRLGGSYDADVALRVGFVAVWCIQDEETERPTMATVVKMLEGVVAVPVPPAPKLLQALVAGESFQGVRADSGDESPEYRRSSKSSPVNVDADETRGNSN